MNNENEQLWEAMKQRKYDNTLGEVQNAINEAKDIDEVLKIILNSFINAVHAETGTLWYYDKVSTGKIYARTTYNDIDLSNTKLNLGQGIAGSVIKDNQALIISDCTKDSRWNSKVDEKTGFITRSMICVPLTIKGYDSPFAAIQIINKKDNTLYDDKDLKFAIDLANKMVDLFISKTDKKTFEIIARKRIDLELDEILNIFDENSAFERLKYTLNRLDLNETDKNIVLTDFMDIYKILYKNN